MKILITGAAGFIGHALTKALAANPKIEIVGIDNLNDYYSPRLKEARLTDLGIYAYGDLPAPSSTWPNVRFQKVDIADRKAMEDLMANGQFTHVCHLAGQAGVRYSIDNPYTYVENNVMGFLNILEGCRNHGVKHLVFASSSSVYGMGKQVPFAESCDTSHPVSLYAATKKSDEVMAYSYASLYGFQTTALRFFTVYGPWGRPDMAPIKFMDAIANGRPIQVFNQGNMLRDFTYIDDIVEGIRCVIEAHYADKVPARVYNIGCSHPVKLIHFIHTIEEATGRQAQMIMMDMQPGDVTRTDADTTSLEHDFGFHPTTDIHEGVARLYAWYKKVWPTIQ